MSSQCTELLAYLKKHHSITTLGAMEKLRILRLSGARLQPSIAMAIPVLMWLTHWHDS